MLTLQGTVEKILIRKCGGEEKLAPFLFLMVG